LCIAVSHHLAVFEWQMTSDVVGMLELVVLKLRKRVRSRIAAACSVAGTL
jgi:hypothetical protein